MGFEILNFENYERKEHFLHYLNNVSCSYSISVNLDITSLLAELKKRNIHFYPVILFAITTIANKHSELRMALDEKGRLGYYTTVNPTYTVFHKDNETFSSIWTEYDSNFAKFSNNYNKDIQDYGNIKGFITKQSNESNLINISAIPWVSFTGFNLNLPQNGKYLLPIFTIGKFFESDGKTLLPLSMQVHHAVCDGFHASRFINELQEMLTDYEKWLSR